MRIMDNLTSNNIETVKMTLRLLNVEEELINEVNFYTVSQINIFFLEGFFETYSIMSSDLLILEIIGKIAYYKSEMTTYIDPSSNNPFLNFTKKTIKFIKLKEINYDNN